MSKVLQNALLEHSAILLPCIKRQSVLKTKCWSFCGWLLKTGVLPYLVNCCFHCASLCYALVLLNSFFVSFLVYNNHLAEEERESLLF